MARGRSVGIDVVRNTSGTLRTRLVPILSSTYRLSACRFPLLRSTSRGPNYLRGSVLHGYRTDLERTMSRAGFDITNLRKDKEIPRLILGSSIVFVIPKGQTLQIAPKAICRHFGTPMAAILPRAEDRRDRKIWPSTVKQVRWRR